MKAQYDTILFDLDGTLIDNFEALHLSYVYAFEQLGLDPPSFEKVKCSVGGSSPITMRKLIGEDLAAEAMPHFEKHFHEIMLEGVCVLPGVIELLEKLKPSAWRMAVFTNKYASASRTICEHLGIAQYFDAIIGTGECPWRKPEREFTQYALEILGAIPEQTILIGDSPFDIQSAAVLELPAYLVATGTHSEEELRAAKPAPSEVYASMKELEGELFSI